MANPYGTFESNWKHDISIRGIKMIDIGYLFAAASIGGYIASRSLSHIFKFDKKHYEDKIKAESSDETLKTKIKFRGSAALWCLR